ncbi:MAG: hypothetical protein IJ059_02875 [Prevotella sp.]|nr:hypothetical protein [Prevotella sp.]
MNKVDDILERLKGQQPVIGDPDALTDRIMDSLPDWEPSEVPQRSARVVSMRRRWMTAAASILLIIGVGTVWVKETGVRSQESGVRSEANTYVAQNAESSLKVEEHANASLGSQPNPDVQTIPVSEERSQAVVKAQKAPEKSEKYERGDYLPLPPSANEPQTHYAALVNTADSLTYQDPARMDEFITKLADFNKVEAVPMDCTLDNNDSTVVSKAYVFDDTQELDLFSRLLQAACWYDSKTPDYLLNFSHQQFFFTMKDLHKHEKFLWIAERINGGRILLFSTHSPIETEVSSTCFQKYREQLTHTNFSTLQF